jgi:monoamine oxidase
MSRTRLFDEVLHAYRLARVSLRTGESAQEVVERAHQAEALSRRRFLGVSAAGMAALALDGCMRPGYPAPRPGQEPVLIVGGGIAGLTAAHRLRQQGVAVRVMEAQNRVGGRMFSLRGHFAEGQVAELGGELIDTGHLRIRRLARELGIALDDLSRYAPGATRDLCFFGGRVRGAAELVEAFRPLALAIQRELATLGSSEVTAANPAGAQALDRTTLAEWLERAPGEGWFRDLLRTA